MLPQKYNSIVYFVIKHTSNRYLTINEPKELISRRLAEPKI